MIFIACPVASWTDPKDALINPRGQKVCMQQCGTSALKCPEAFVSSPLLSDVILAHEVNKWKEQVNFCYRCCTTWGETVIKIQCDEFGKNKTHTKEQEKPPVGNQEKDQQRELGFS